jgi:hypothetical protein
MFAEISILEWIGYIASVVVAISLMMVSIVKLRWLNLFGSAVFSFYGFAIGAYPVGVLNLFIALVNIYYLKAIYSRKEAFKIISIQSDSPYLTYFLNFYGNEIEKFFPGSAKLKEKILDQGEGRINLIILRNAAVAGIFTGQRRGQELWVDLDFVIPEFRDLKPGRFLYEENRDFFLSNEITCIIGSALSVKHQNYLNRMGFIMYPGETSNGLFVKKYVK